MRQVVNPFLRLIPTESLSLSPYSLATYNIGTRYINNFKFLADTLMENLKGENHLIGHARGRTSVQARAKRYMS